MKKFYFVIILVLLATGAWYWFYKVQGGQPLAVSVPNIANPFNPEGTPIAVDTEAVKVIATGLDTPWGIAFLPDRSMLVTERKGTVRLINSKGELQSQPIATIEAAKEIGEGGLLGVAVHPEFSNNHFIYFYYTYNETGLNTLNRVVWVAYEKGRLTDEKIIVDQIPGAANHNGGRMKFGPDGLLYVATGDAQDSSLAPNKDSLAGKILRITDKGRAAPGNPFGSRVYSYGHRNIQGLTWDKNGNMFATEHGRSGVQSGLDEINLIQAGSNYGWPDSQGDEVKSGTVAPIRHSGPTTTWAPSGVAYLDNSLYFGGLRGQSLYEAVLEGTKVVEVKEHFKGQFGRIRDVVVGPDKMLYITTSNRDGRGNPADTDDRVIRINPSKL